MACFRHPSPVAHLAQSETIVRARGIFRFLVPMRSRGRGPHRHTIEIRNKGGGTYSMYSRLIPLALAGAVGVAFLSGCQCRPNYVAARPCCPSCVDSIQPPPRVMPVPAAPYSPPVGGPAPAGYLSPAPESRLPAGPSVPVPVSPPVPALP